MSDDKLHRIEEKVDKVVDSIARIDVTLAAQHESLKYHIKRTDMLETDIKPLEAHVHAVQGILKMVGLVSVMAGVVAAMVEVLTYFRR